MKKDKHLIHTTWIVGLIILLAFIVPNFWSNQLIVGEDSRNVYSDENNQISFKYPDDFQIDHSQTDDVTILDVYPEYRSLDAIKPIEIYYEKDNNPGVAVDQQILDANPQLSQKNLHYIKNKQYSGVQVLLTGASGEKELLTYFKANDKVYSLKFNQRIFSPESPLVLIDNTPFVPVYANIVNSINLTANND